MRSSVQAGKSITDGWAVTLLIGSLIALCEVTVNSNYDMSSRIIRFPMDGSSASAGAQSPAHELHRSAALFTDNDGNMSAGRDVVTGLELGQVFVTVLFRPVFKLAFPCFHSF
jgi:hypothetical protein